MGNNIGYHTRDVNGIKVVGGTFGGTISQETVDRLVNAHFPLVNISPAGFPKFVDEQGREVSLYLHVDPFTTEPGRRAKEERAEKRRQEKQMEEDKRAEVERLMDGMTYDEIISRLRN